MYIRRPCGCRCVQYSILGGKAQGVRAIFLRQWIFSFLVGQGRVIPHPAGGLPLRCRLTLPPLYPAGGLPSLPPATPAFSLLYCPIPPAPFPVGRGRPRLFHARGFAPCIPGAEPGRHWGRGRTTHPAGELAPAVPAYLAAAVPGGGACLLCRPLPLPLACFVAPVPPTRARRALFPAGRGRPRLFHARGFAPCILSIRPPAALTDPAEAAPCGWLAFFVACRPCLWFLILPPIPPPPSQREGGDYKFILPGATAPGTPALNRLRHWLGGRLWYLWGA